MILNGSPDNPAIITSHGTMTYSDMEAHIALCMEHFTRCGLIPGHKAALLMPLSPRYIILLAALMRYGAVACPLSTRLPNEGIETALKTLGANAVFNADNATGIGSNCMTPLYYDRMHPADLDNPMVEDDLHFSSTPDPTTPAVAIFTSGSSGPPKAAVLSQHNLNTSAAAMNKVIPLEPGDRWLLSLPLYHVGGLSILYRCFQAGAAVALPESSQSLIGSIQTTTCTHVSMVSTQLYRTRQDDHDRELLSSLKAVMLGGSAVPKSLVQQAVNANIPIHTSYGMTETAAAIACTSSHASLNELTTSGVPIHPNSVRVNQEGCLKVSGPSLFLGYLAQGKMNPAPLRDGWFTTNDRGYLDDEGRVLITGRSDNMMISGGENIQPEEIEAAICDQPGVVRAIVIPESDSEFGQRPIAFVDTDDEIDTQVLMESLRVILPGFKVPKRIEPWPTDAPEGGIKANRTWFKGLVS